MKKFDLHPAVLLLPEMLPEEYESLKRDIERNGQNEPIVLYDGKLLDGRHRARACDELGIEIQSRKLNETCDPHLYVVSANLQRRQLANSQKAMVAARLSNRKVGTNQHDTEGPQNCGPSIANVAELIGVSPRLVDAAKRVQRDGSELLCTAVDQKKITVSLAEKLVGVEPSKDKQSELVRLGRQAIREFIKKQHNDVADSVGQNEEVNAVSESTKASDPQQIVDEEDAEQVAEWDNAESDTTREMEGGESQAVAAAPSVAESKDDRVKLARAKLLEFIGHVIRSIDEMHDASPNKESRDVMHKFCEGLDHGAKQW